MASCLQAASLGLLEFVGRRFGAIERLIVAPAIKDVGYPNAFAFNRVSDDGGMFKRESSQAGEKVIARTPPPKGTSPTRSHRSRIRCVKRRAISALPLTSKIYSKIVSRSNVAEGRNSTRRRFIGGCLFLRLRSGKERVERRVNFPKGHVRARIVKRTTNAGANHGKAVRVLRPLASPNPDGIAEGFARGSIFAVLDARTKRGRHVG